MEDRGERMERLAFGRLFASARENLRNVLLVSTVPVAFPHYSPICIYLSMRLRGKSPAAGF
jgi:hypothetical protein